MNDIIINTEFINEISKKKIKSVTVRKKYLFKIINFKFRFEKSKLSERGKEQFYFTFLTLLKAGVDIRNIFEILLSEKRKSIQTRMIEIVNAKILNGVPLWKAMNSTNMFGTYEINCIRVGEESKQLEMVFNELYNYTQNKIKQRKQLTRMLAYPSVVLIISLTAIIFMTNFVVPMFSEIFKQNKTDLPFITKFILEVSEFMKDQKFVITLLIILILSVFYYFNKKNQLKNKFIKIVSQLPITGKLIQKIYIFRFCNLMSMLLGARIPLEKSLEIAGQTLVYKKDDTIVKKITNRIISGKKLSEAIKEEKIFDQTMVTFIQIGEESSQLDSAFKKLSNQYSADIDQWIDWMNAVAEPLIILLLGLIVGLILAAMYMPLFEMGIKMG